MAHELIHPDHYLSLFLSDTPLLDVRAEIEFACGAFPTAVNHPILTTSEREQVGRCYKTRGQDAAIRLGHDLVKGAVKDARVAAWAAFAKKNPHGALYCFRGGLRSKIAQEWLREAGVPYPRIAGGYKSLRKFLLDSLVKICATTEFLILSGRTGTGKTELLQEFENGLDLESFARHRGSAFGGMHQEQPAFVDFENAVIIRLIKLVQAQASPILIEDEGQNIGRVFIPKILYEKMGASPIVVLETPLERRVTNILKEYVIERYQDLGGNASPMAFQKLSDALLIPIEKIAKRLGPQRTAIVREKIKLALDEQKRSGDFGRHQDWIFDLLQDYYDPLYDRLLAKKSHLIRFRGAADGVRSLLSTR